MNARQKCKKLKKELQKLKDKPILGYVVQAQMPIDRYATAFRIDYNDTRFPTSVEQQEKLVKHYCAEQTAEFIEKHFHITREKEDENGKTYYIEFWIGQDNEQYHK